MGVQGVVGYIGWGPPGRLGSLERVLVGTRRDAVGYGGPEGPPGRSLIVQLCRPRRRVA